TNTLGCWYRVHQRQAARVLTTLPAKESPARGEEGRALVRSALSARWGATDAIETCRQRRSSTSNQGVLASSSPTAADRADHEEAPARGSTGASVHHGEMAFYC